MNQPRTTPEIAPPTSPRGQRGAAGLIAQYVRELSAPRPGARRMGVREPLNPREGRVCPA
jgi:hypothetical protein